MAKILTPELESESRPVLYTFRRCPYAIRTRMVLAYTGVLVENREVVLKNKPLEMLQASPKGTVPVLVLLDGAVLDESADIMRWALAKNDPKDWLTNELRPTRNALIDENDGVFKSHLDRYKYADRYPGEPMEAYRGRGELFLQKLEEHLELKNFLLRETVSFADVAIFPFIRQFAFVDKDWFDQTDYPKLQQWLAYFLNSDLFISVMEKSPPWQPGG